MALRISKVQDEKSKIFLNKLLKLLSKQFTKMGRKNSSLLMLYFEATRKMPKVTICDNVIFIGFFRRPFLRVLMFPISVLKSHL